MDVKNSATAFSEKKKTADYEKRMKMELYYVDNISFKLDIQIFFKTIISVLKREGAK